MSDNLFAREDEAVIAPAARPPPHLPPHQDTATPETDAGTFLFGINPLIAAAAPLLQLLGRLRTTVTSPDINVLRNHAIAQLRQFEIDARACGVSIEQLRPAHYALCAAIDDVVLNTAWGSQGGWAPRTIVSTLYPATSSGERYTRVLEDLVKTPATYLPVLELMYYCLNLGFLGQYRLSPHRPTEVDRIRDNLYATVGRRGPAARNVASPSRNRVKPPDKATGVAMPGWASAAACLVLIGGFFIWLSFG